MPNPTHRRLRIKYEDGSPDTLIQWSVRKNRMGFFSEVEIHHERTDTEGRAYWQKQPKRTDIYEIGIMAMAELLQQTLGTNDNGETEITMKELILDSGEEEDDHHAYD